MTGSSARISSSAPHPRDLGPALLSALVPGLGQLIQRRPLVAALQFGTVVAYGFGVLGLGGRRALFLALAWNVWSIVDAVRHEAD